VEFSDDAIVSKTLDGVVTSWNAGAERLYGYSAAETVGRPISIIIPPDRPNELLRVLARVRRGEHIQPYEATRIRKDGSRVQVSVTVSPLRSSSGIIIGASAIGRDVTEKKRADAALREAATLRSVASLAVAAAHEINNPLTVVSGELQLSPARPAPAGRADRVDTRSARTHPGSRHADEPDHPARARGAPAAPSGNARPREVERQPGATGRRPRAAS